MAYDEEAKKLAIKAIGTVESGLNYTSINYNDPITIGFMQWYGTRAAGLLGRIRAENPSSWVGVEASLTADLDAHPADDSTFWTNRYLARDEGESIREVLNNNKAIQNAQAMSDLDAYYVAAVRAGMDPENNTQGVLFFYVMYHQSPRRALGVVRNAGPSAGMARLYSVCLNEEVLKNYRTRYSTARDIIASGDTSGIDDLPGPTPEPPEPGGDAGGDGLTRLAASLSSIRVVGDELHLALREGRTLICPPLGQGSWLVPRAPDTGAPVVPLPPNPDPGVPPSEGVAAQRAALVAFLTDRVGRYRYSQGASRLDPEANLYTDCSGLVYFAYQQVVGINIGTYTGNQYTQGTLVTEGSGTVDESLLRPGDLIFYNWPGGRTTVDHVEMYIGGSQTCGHGGPGAGPTIKPLSGGIGRALNYFVRRHVN